MTDHNLDIKVDRTMCAGTSNCERIASHTFRLSGGLSEVVNPAGDSQEDVLEAAMSCPVEAITVSDPNGEVLYPND